MAGIRFTTNSSPIGSIGFNGGLNTSAGPLSLQDNESPDLQNVDFNNFGSVVQRNGYSVLNETAITNTPSSDGMYWYEFDNSGSPVRKLINIADGKLYKMDSLDGTFDDETNGLTITAGNYCSFATFLKTLYVCNGNDAPFEWDGSTGTATTSTLPTGVTKPKFVAVFNNYMFYANVFVSSSLNASRLYWCDIKDTSSWPTTNFIDVSKDDGQDITGLKVLADRLIVYKTRSIYTIFFTGDVDIPFILPGGGKTNSSVGCIAPYSIQEVQNGHVFLSSDGFYYFDGNNSYKISEKINPTINGLNNTRFPLSVGVVQRDKNKYICAMTSSGETAHDRALVWDYSINSWSIYTGMDISSSVIAYDGGSDEKWFFADYAGYVYQGDNGTNDNPLGVETAITSYYKTNWKSYNDLVNDKGIAHITIYYQNSSGTLTFGYSFDLSESASSSVTTLPGMTYSTTFALSTGDSKYGVAKYGSSVYGGSGGGIERRDLNGRGRVVQFLFGNNSVDENFQIDGLGQLPHLEASV